MFNPCVCIEFLRSAQKLTVACKQDSHLAVGHAVEVIGKVDQNLAVKVQASTDFGTSVGTSWMFFYFLMSRQALKHSEDLRRFVLLGERRIRADIMFRF